MANRKGGKEDSVSVLLIEALSAVWSGIRSLHPAVPNVVLLAAPAQRDRLNVLGHFAALRWMTKKSHKGAPSGKGDHLHEVVVVAEHLDREAEEIVGTLIHEAAHAMNFEQGIFDCSRSQYHNQRFKEAAEDLGLEVQQVPHYGFAYTRLTEKTSAVYRKEIDDLKKALVHRRRPLVVYKTAGSDPAVDDDDKSSSRNRKAICACAPPFIIRVSRRTLAQTRIVCEKCGEAFGIT